MAKCFFTCKQKNYKQGEIKTMSKMSSDTYYYLKDCLEVYKRTENIDVLREIREIFNNHRDDPDAKSLTSGLSL